MSVINRNMVLERLGGDEDLYNEICELFLRDGPTMIERLRIELANDCLEVATRYAHSIKSMAANVGADELAEIARVAEAAGRANDMDKIKRQFKLVESAFAVALSKLSDN